MQFIKCLTAEYIGWYSELVYLSAVFSDSTNLAAVVIPSSSVLEISFAK